MRGRVVSSSPTGAPSAPVNCPGGPARRAPAALHVVTQEAASPEDLPVICISSSPPARQATLPTLPVLHTHCTPASCSRLTCGQVQAQVRQVQVYLTRPSHRPQSRPRGCCQRSLGEQEVKESTFLPALSDFPAWSDRGQWQGEGTSSHLPKPRPHAQARSSARKPHL